MGRVRLLFRALVSRRWGWVTAVVVLGMAGLVRLGVWQLARLEERRAENVALLAVLQAEPLDLATAVFPPNVASLKDRQAVATGTFDFGYQGLLKLQVWQGRAGAHLLAPLVLADGQTAVLVDRGWIPEAETAVAARQQYDEPGEQTIRGYIGLTQTRANVISTDPNLEWFRVDLAQIQQEMPYELLPIYLVQTPGDEFATNPPFRAVQEIDLSEGSHLSYAIQWFIFSLILGGGYLIFVNKQGSGT